jgi:hypothetical protein
VNFDDYVRIDNGFNNHLTGWLNGDFDLNGQVNFDDYVLIDLAFNTQSGTLRRALAYLDGREEAGDGSASGSAPGARAGSLPRVWRSVSKCFHRCGPRTLPGRTRGGIARAWASPTPTAPTNGCGLVSVLQPRDVLFSTRTNAL